MLPDLNLTDRPNPTVRWIQKQIPESEVGRYTEAWDTSDPFNAVLPVFPRELIAVGIDPTVPLPSPDVLIRKIKAHYDTPESPDQIPLFEVPAAQLPEATNRWMLDGYTAQIVVSTAGAHDDTWANEAVRLDADVIPLLSLSPVDMTPESVFVAAQTISAGNDSWVLASDNTIGHKQAIHESTANGEPFCVDVDTDRFVALDIDAAGQSDRVSRFVQIVERITGCTGVVFASGQHDRWHVFFRLASTSWEAEVIRRSARFLRWDDRKRIRPPGALHRSGTVASRLVWPERPAAEPLLWTRDDVAAAHTKASAEAARLHVVRAKRAERRAVAAKKKTPEGMRPLPSHIQQLRDRGNPENSTFCFRTKSKKHMACCQRSNGTVRCYDTASEAIQAVLASAAQRGWSLEKTVAYCENSPLGRHQRKKGPDCSAEPSPWYRRSWDNAVLFAEVRPSQGGNGDGVRRFTEEVMRAAALTTFNSATTRTVLVAHIVAATRTGTAAGYATSQDKIADYAGVGSRKTVVRAENELVERGFLRPRWQSYSIGMGSRWELRVPPEFSVASLRNQTVERFGRNPSSVFADPVVADPGHDVWLSAGLGPSAWEVRYFLSIIKHGSAKELARLTGRHIGTVYRALAKLADHGLVSVNERRTNRTWSARAPRDVVNTFAVATARLGVSGLRQTRNSKRAVQAELRAIRVAQRAELRRVNGKSRALPDGTKVIRKFREPVAAAVERARVHAGLSGSGPPVPIAA